MQVQRNVGLINAAVLGVLLLGICCGAGEREATLAGFALPSREFKPVVWWRFMRDLATREGVAADIDSMEKIGVRGAVVSYCDTGPTGIPLSGLPVVPILSREWWDMVGFQKQEAAAQKLDLWFQACPGYATCGGPWVTPELSMQKLVWSETTVEGGVGFDGILERAAVDKRWNYYRDVGVVAVRGGAGAIKLADVVDLSGQMDASGRLTWIPKEHAGHWTIVRFGHTTTGITNHPATAQGTGLECDKMSRVATGVMFENYFKRILAQQVAKGQAGKIELFYVSWEAGNQNWTGGFREEFTRRRRYDPLAWLLVATGRTVESQELSRRFDYDWKTTVEEMVTSEHFGELARLAHEAGCDSFRAQPYNGNVNFMTAGAKFDVPEGEFWHVNKSYGWWTLRMVASVAHVNGKRIASAEALTSSPEHLRMDVDPYATKAETDLAFAMGINSLAVHVMAHNPWPELRPGMIAGPYGPLVGTGQVWTPLAGSWMTYLGRCCYLLQQGIPAADVVTVFRPSQRGFEPPAGYASDVCDEDRIVEAMTWDGEALCLPGGEGSPGRGMRYRVLELPDTTRVLSPSLSPSGIERRMGEQPMRQSMSLRLARKVRELVRAGATVVGPKPEMTPGLGDRESGDQELREIARELWGDQGGGIVDRRVGNGRVVNGMRVGEVLAVMGVGPDVRVEHIVGGGDGADGDMPWIHRRLGRDEVYFISNQKPMAVKRLVSFRVEGKVPELWHADTGQCEEPVSWSCHDGRTTVELELDPRGSVFVYFRGREGEGKTAAEGRRKGRHGVGSVKVDENWSVRFDESMGAPASVEFPMLVSWTTRPERGVKFYSGIAVYEKDVEIPEEVLGREGIGGRVVLDLGEVKNLARVTVNGRVCGELWKPPFVCDVTSAIRVGTNHVAIEVVNLWANRLVGDEQEPADVEWGEERYTREGLYTGRRLERYPDWLRKGTTRPSGGRKTFATWNYVRKDQALISSGLLGPVVVRGSIEEK